MCAFVFAFAFAFAFGCDVKRCADGGGRGDTRCARNCFLCPNCRNTLTVVPSDPPEDVDSRMSPIVSTTLGEPPFFLYCNHCRWDSAEVGITFEKPTGLAGACPFRYISSPPFLLPSLACKVLGA